MTDVYGIFGFPVGHSRSPAMHNAAFRALGLDAVYVPFAVSPHELPRAVAAISALSLCGVNVTLPHKTNIMKLLDRVHADALVIGAVNTVYRDGGQLCGENTDAPGLARALSEANVALAGARVTVLGGGGASRASVVGLSRAGAAQITVATRRGAEADRLVQELGGHVAPCRLAACALTSAALTPVLQQTTLLVQATSATLGDGEAARELAALLPLAALPEQAVVTDLVYQPRTTTVMRAAQLRGLRVVDGLPMLLHQGALAFERWTGQKAPLAVMQEALENGR